MRIYCNALLALFLMLLAEAGLFQQQKPDFEIKKWSEYDRCGFEPGISFDSGHVYNAKPNQIVNIEIFVRKKDGSFSSFNFFNSGNGIIALDLASCNFTGEHYVYADYAGSPQELPDEKRIADIHKEKADMRPVIKITEPKKRLDCSEGYVFERAFVFSPTGGFVSFDLLYQKTTGEWKRHTFKRLGTGVMNLNVEDCSLTGAYKVLINERTTP